MKNCSKCGIEKAESEFYTGRKKCKVCIIEYSRKYQKTEKGKAVRRKYLQSEKGRVLRRKCDRKYKQSEKGIVLKNKPIEKIKKRLRQRLYNFLILGFDTKRSRELMGCTRDFLRAHYESLFKPGMTWENYGEWESDHIKEMKTFDLFNKETHTLCMHYSNLQPQWKTLNCRNIH